MSSEIFDGQAYLRAKAQHMKSPATSQQFYRSNL